MVTAQASGVAARMGKHMAALAVTYSLNAPLPVQATAWPTCTWAVAGPAGTIFRGTGPPGRRQHTCRVSTSGPTAATTPVPSAPSGNSASWCCRWNLLAGALSSQLAPARQAGQRHVHTSARPAP